VTAGETVWENLGWHWKIEKGKFHIRANRGRPACYSAQYDHTSNYHSASNPKTALTEVLTQMANEIRHMQADIKAVVGISVPLINKRDRHVHKQTRKRANLRRPTKRKV
jgi:hypothetical protein